MSGFSFNPIHHHCGPFNAVDEKRPDNLNDAGCWEHDLAYGKMQEEKGGAYPYLHFNQADQRFLENPNISFFYKAPFWAKKLLAPKAQSFSKSQPKVNDVRSFLSKAQGDMANGKSSSSSKKRVSKRSRSKSLSKFVTKKGVKRIMNNDQYGGLVQKMSMGGSPIVGTINQVTYTEYLMDIRSEVVARQDESGMRTRDQITSSVYDGTLELAGNLPDGTVTAYQDTKYKNEGGYTQWLLKNNDNVPFYIKAYLWQCVEDTSSLPSTGFHAAIDEKYHDDVGITDKFMEYPSSYGPAIRDGGWEMRGSVLEARLRPGEEFKVLVPHKKKVVRLNQLTALSYVSGLSQCLMIRSHGEICHDNTTPSLVGYADYQIDVIKMQKCKYRFTDATGRKLETHYNSVTGLDAVTTPVVGGYNYQGEQPIAN